MRAIFRGRAGEEVKSRSRVFPAVVRQSTGQESVTPLSDNCPTVGRQKQKILRLLHRRRISGVSRYPMRREQKNLRFPGYCPTVYPGGPFGQGSALPWGAAGREMGDGKDRRYRTTLVNVGQVVYRSPRTRAMLVAAHPATSVVTLSSNPLLLSRSARPPQRGQAREIQLKTVGVDGEIAPSRGVGGGLPRYGGLSVIGSGPR